MVRNEPSRPEIRTSKCCRSGPRRKETNGVNERQYESDGGSVQKGPSGRRKSLLLKIGLMTASTIFALGVLEAVLSLVYEHRLDLWQVSGIYQPDSELIYSLRPGAEGSWIEGEFAEESRINSLGLRGDELGEAGSFEKRILILGDSMTFGHGVSHGEPYPSVLEDTFRTEQREIEVVNAGVKGYGTDHSLLLFSKRLRSLQPDLVILAVYPNDYWDNLNMPLMTVEGDSLVELGATGNWLYVLGSAQESVPRVIGRTRIFDFVMTRFVGTKLFSGAPEMSKNESFRWSVKKTGLEIRSFFEMSRRDGFDFWIVCLPCKPGEDNNYWWIQETSKPFRRVSAHGPGLRFLDLSRSPMVGMDGMFFETDHHYTPQGHRALAGQLYGALTHSGF